LENKNWYEEQVNVKQCEQKESTIGSPLLAKCDSFKPKHEHISDYNG